MDDFRTDALKRLHVWFRNNRKPMSVFHAVERVLDVLPDEYYEMWPVEISMDHSPSSTRFNTLTASFRPKTILERKPVSQVHSNHQSLMEDRRYPMMIVREDQVYVTYGDHKAPRVTALKWVGTRENPSIVIQEYVAECLLSDL